MKPLGEMTKRELLAFAEANEIMLSSATRLSRKDLERAIRKIVQERYRRDH